MNSQTSLVLQNYRLQQWTVQINECQNRPKEMPIPDKVESVREKSFRSI